MFEPQVFMDAIYINTCIQSLYIPALRYESQIHLLFLDCSSFQIKTLKDYNLSVLFILVNSQPTKHPHNELKTQLM